MGHILAAVYLLIASLTVNGQSGATCSSTSPCSSSAPCCSEFGFCGSGSFCLGGCNPLASHNLQSCMPEPVCQNVNHTFTDNSRILSNSSDFDGNATQYDWVLDKGNISNTNSSGGELVMILTEANGGTRLSSTRYVHYGTITARVKTGRWAGVVTAFIIMSDIKDEIDWEFPGAETTQGQTNYFWQGVIPQTTHGTTEKGISDTYKNYHDYTIDWQPDSLSFLINGNNVRTIKASDAVSNGVSQYPNTPSRIQLSLWPAGINSSAAGTVQWAGGMIDWTDPDYVSAGHFQAFVSSVSVKCADIVNKNSNITSYVYASNSSESTPNITLSTASTLIDGATSGGSSISPSTVKKIGITVGLGLLGLIVSALLVRMCVRMRRHRAKPTAGGSVGIGGQNYRPLHDPTPDTAMETHAMPNLYNQGSQGYSAQPYGQQARYGS